MTAVRAALLLALVGVAPARAQPDHPLLFPSAAALTLAEERRTAAQLTRSLELLPDVLAARVQISLPTSQAPLDQPAPAARMSIALSLGGDGPSDGTVLALAHASTQRPLAQPVSITRSRPAKATTAHAGTVKVGPFEVSSRSAGLLKATLATSLIANVCLATLLLARRKRRGLRNQQN